MRKVQWILILILAGASIACQKQTLKFPSQSSSNSSSSRFAVSGGGSSFVGTYTYGATDKDLQEISKLGIQSIIEYKTDPNELLTRLKAMKSNLKVVIPIYFHSIVNNTQRKVKSISRVEMESHIMNVKNSLAPWIGQISGVYLFDEPEYTGFTKEQVQWGVDLSNVAFPGVPTYIAYSQKADDWNAPTGLNYRMIEFYGEQSVEKSIKRLNGLKSKLNGSHFVIIPRAWDDEAPYCCDAAFGKNWSDTKIAALHESLLPKLIVDPDVAGIFEYIWNTDAPDLGLKDLPQTQEAISKFLTNFVYVGLPKTGVCSVVIFGPNGNALEKKVAEIEFSNSDQIQTFVYTCNKTIIDSLPNLCQSLGVTKYRGVVTTDATYERGLVRRLFTVDTAVEFPTSDRLHFCKTEVVPKNVVKPTLSFCGLSIKTKDGREFHPDLGPKPVGDQAAVDAYSHECTVHSIDAINQFCKTAAVGTRYQGLMVVKTQMTDNTIVNSLRIDTRIKFPTSDGFLGCGK